MGPYQNNNRRFGQTMSKSNKNSSSSRYQRQFGNSGNQSRQQSNDSSKADEIALKRRLRQEQGELIDKKFGYYRLEDQYQERQNNPKLLCLDEPAAGLNPKESSELNKLLRFIKTEKKTGILLIEHDMSVVMGISDHVVVLNYGKKIFEGTAKDSRNSKEVIEAYLGVEE